MHEILLKKMYNSKFELLRSGMKVKRLKWKGSEEGECLTYSLLPSVPMLADNRATRLVVPLT